MTCMLQVDPLLVLAQKECKRRHDKVARSIGIWQESVGLKGMIGGMTTHVPDILTLSDNYKLLWDFSIQTGHETGARRPYLVISLTREERAVNL